MTNPYEPPGDAPSGVPGEHPLFSPKELSAIARSQRTMLIAYAVLIGARFVVHGVGALFVVLPAWVALVFVGHRLARELRQPNAWLWAVAFVVPLVNLVAMLVLVRKATRVLREANLRVGLFGSAGPAATR